tara:strand:+ start:8533 stop:8916 length:384 start_codon:yes stop_codon:yes gene_type:complete
MADKLSIKGFIDTELHDLLKQYLNYDIDCKITRNKELYNTDLDVNGYIKDNFIYHLLIGEEEITIIRTYNGCPLLSHIVSLLENTTEHINIDAISDYLSSLNWGDCIINHLFTYDNNEGTIYSVIEL